MFRFKPDLAIADFITLSTHVSPFVMKTREGDYLMTWYLEGLPFVGRNDNDMAHRHQTFNRLLQSLRAPDASNLAFWVHDVRRHRAVHMPAVFRSPLHQQIHERYFTAFAGADMRVNELYLTMIYRPVVTGKRFRAKSHDTEQMQREQDSAIQTLIELGQNIESVLHDYCPYALGMYENPQGVYCSELLEFFAYLMNRSDEPVPVLNAPAYQYLATSKHTFSSKVGDFVVTTPEGQHHYGACLNLKEYTDATYPGILNGLKYLPFDYVLTHSFSPLDRFNGLRVLDRTKGLMISSGDRSVSQISALDQAMDELSSGRFVLGEYHFSLMVYAQDYDELYRYVAQARVELSNAGFVTTKEETAVAASFYAQLPTNWRYRPRIANISSLNFLGLAPLHSFSSGKRGHNPWGECVTVLQGINGQPYYFNFHDTARAEHSEGYHALGNTMILGKSGTGKTALMNFLIAQTQKYQPAPTVFVFDKDRSSELFIRASGGQYLSFALGEATQLNPLSCEPTAANEYFLTQWVKMLAGKPYYSPREEQDILHAIRAMLDTPVHLRTLTNLQKSLPNHGDDSVYERLRQWLKGNRLGWVFDHGRPEFDFAHAHMVGVDYTAILDQDTIRAPIIAYLLHRLEQRLTGAPLIYVMDEFWKVLDGDNGLKDFAKNKQKTIRKQNGLGIFASQSPEDALKSDIAAALIEQTATLILMPNPNADADEYMSGLKLSESEFQIVRSLDERSRSFLIKQGADTTVCRLDLSQMHELLPILSATTEHIQRAQHLRDTVGDEHWLAAFHASVLNESVSKQTIHTAQRFANSRASLNQSDEGL